MGIELIKDSSGSVRFSQPMSSVRFGFGCQNFWVRSVQFEMALKWGSSLVRSVQVRFDSHLYCECVTDRTKMRVMTVMMMLHVYHHVNHLNVNHLNVKLSVN